MSGVSDVSTTRRRGPHRRGPMPAVLACLLVVAALALGVWVQFGERQAQDTAASRPRTFPSR
ncbi:hypothetical protein [Streptomyces sp. NPDC085466]|uniref:hypothetical protein n=1 Tax=Streptomyces sp. NPDC085466 TaxID=3365725 RepID=UPI0037CEEE19